MRKFLGAGLAALFCAGQAMATDIIHTFDSSDEGWTVSAGTNTMLYHGSGGNPGGYLSFKDEVAGFMVAVGPSSLDQGYILNPFSTIAFDTIHLLDNNDSIIPEFGTITVTGGGLTASLDLVQALLLPEDLTMPTVWTTYSAPLDAALWGLSSTDWETLWLDLDSVEIILDSQEFFTDTVGFDNFSLINVALVPVPAALWLFVPGLALLGVGGIRRH